MSTEESGEAYFLCRDKWFRTVNDNGIPPQNLNECLERIKRAKNAILKSADVPPQTSESPSGGLNSSKPNNSDFQMPHKPLSREELDNSMKELGENMARRDHVRDSLIGNYEAVINVQKDIISRQKALINKQGELIKDQGKLIRTSQCCIS